MICTEHQLATKGLVLLLLAWIAEGQKRRVTTLLLGLLKLEVNFVYAFRYAEPPSPALMVNAATMVPLHAYNMAQKHMTSLTFEYSSRNAAAVASLSSSILRRVWVTVGASITTNTCEGP